MKVETKNLYVVFVGPSCPRQFQKLPRSQRISSPYWKSELTDWGHVELDQRAYVSHITNFITLHCCLQNCCGIVTVSYTLNQYRAYVSHWTFVFITDQFLSNASKEPSRNSVGYTSFNFLSHTITNSTSFSIRDKNRWACIDIPTVGTTATKLSFQKSNKWNILTRIIFSKFAYPLNQYN